jgi:hypothetical protein
VLEIFLVYLATVSVCGFGILFLVWRLFWVVFDGGLMVLSTLLCATSDVGLGVFLPGFLHTKLI